LKIIIGLGNPGKEYANNRHNIGFKVIDCLARRLRVKVDKAACGCLLGEKKGRSLILAKPMTFMNASGGAVESVVDGYGPERKDILIICDDFNLALGKLRIRRGGSSGGHNGIESIINALSSERFPRMRIGIGMPQTDMDMADYVLEDFEKSEEEKVEKMIETACDAAGMFIYRGIVAAMDKYNNFGIEP